LLGIGNEGGQLRLEALAEDDGKGNGPHGGEGG
jgi:hypothetical protein